MGVSSCAIAVGALLLVGGRLGDLFGRPRVFTTGLFGFVADSAVGDLAQTFKVLFAARVGQEVFSAVPAPATLKDRYMKTNKFCAQSEPMRRADFLTPGLAMLVGGYSE